MNCHTSSSIDAELEFEVSNKIL